MKKEVSRWSTDSIGKERGSSSEVGINRFDCLLCLLMTGSCQLKTLLPVLLLAMIFCGNTSAEEVSQDDFVLVEIGDNDFRISDMSPDGDPGWYLGEPRIVWNPIHQCYHTVWDGWNVLNDRYRGLGVFGQVVSDNGYEIGKNDFDIGRQGHNIGRVVDIALNLENQEALVVWEGRLSLNYSIYGQFLNKCGLQVGLNDFTVSGGSDATYPSVAWNSRDDEYLVVWIYAGVAVRGQLFTSSGEPIREEFFQISEWDPWTNNAFAIFTDVAWNSTTNEYFVVWSGFNEAIAPEIGASIFGQRLSARGYELGVNDFVISGPRSSVHIPILPKIAWNKVENEYMVIWDNSVGFSAPYNNEVRGQRLDPQGMEIGENDLLISHDNEEEVFDAKKPDIVWNPDLNEYLVVMQSDEMANEEFEIYARRLDGTGNKLPGGRMRISDMGPDGDDDYDALYPAVALNAEDNQYLVVWNGDDDTGDLVEDHHEIYGQLLGYLPITGPTFTPTPTVLNPTPTPSPTIDLDVFPIGGDGHIDARDLLRVLEGVTGESFTDSLFHLSKEWRIDVECPLE